MVLLDISATGEENIIEQQSGNQMNDLEYRRKQLLKLQDAVIDLEDLSSGVSIADLTLTDFRIDLAAVLSKEHPECLEGAALGTSAQSPLHGRRPRSPPGVIFCLRAEGEAALKTATEARLSARAALSRPCRETTARCCLPFTQAKQVARPTEDYCVGPRRCRMRTPAPASTGDPGRGEHGRRLTLLARRRASIVGKNEERAVASLFSPGGTHAI